MSEENNKSISPLEFDLIFQKYGVGEGITMVDRTLYIETDKLKPHPQNQFIYGNEDVTDLVEQIEAVGKILEPLKIKEDYTIISGHRRWKAAQRLEMEKVPCEVVTFDSDEEELAALVLYNYSRVKTNEQKVREGMILEKTVMEEGFQRKLRSLKQNQTDMDLETISDDNEKGLTRDKVAKAVQMGSGKTYERAKQVLIQADQYKEKGNFDNFELLTTVLNRAPTTAHHLLKVDLQSLSPEDKEKIKTGKVPVEKFIPQEKPSKPLNSQKAFQKSMKEVDKIKQALSELEKAIILITEDEENSKICKSLAEVSDVLIALTNKR